MKFLHITDFIPKLTQATLGWATTSDVSVVEQVKAFYECHPYPAYPLWVRPRWQEGVLGASLTVAHLVSSPPLGDAPRRCLNLGCGDMQPAVLNMWEPADSAVVALDLSQKNLMRARIRVGWGGRRAGRFVWVCADLLSYLSTCKKESFDHIDAYGVLHHVSHPQEALALMTQALKPGGTMRVMVYNGHARGWIHTLQDDFKAKGWDPKKRAHVDEAQAAVLKKAQHDAHVAFKLKGMKPTLTHLGRFADTFMHPQEIRWDLGRWVEAFHSCGLVVKGLYDRYAELDALANPLWQMPTQAELKTAVLSGQFENNGEFFIVKPQDGADSPGRVMSGRPLYQMPLYKSPLYKSPLYKSPLYKKLHHLRFVLPPQCWFSFAETCGVPWLARLQLWHRFIDILEQKSVPRSLPANLPLRTLQRLARVGAVLPDPLLPVSLWSDLIKPMEGACVKVGA